jgi:two-component system, OmpR family, sensor histidine kinase BaeS
MSMRWRLLGAFGLIILIALGTVALVSRFTTQQEVTTFLGHGGQVGLENLADSLEYYYEENGSWTGVESLSRNIPGRGQGQGPRTGVNVSVGEHILADSEGTILVSPSEVEIGTKLTDETLNQGIELKVRGQVVGYLLPEGGIPQLPENFEELLIERVNRASLLAAAISGGVAILLAMILAALILRPVQSLTNAAVNLSEGDLSQRVNVRGKGELSKLGHTFNQMAESLQEAETRRMAMTADIAHELRNPLAIQRAHLEALQDGVYPLNQDNLSLIAEQNEQLTHLVEDLRTLALADAGALSLNKRRINLTKVCQELAIRYEPQANKKNVAIYNECGKRVIYVSADRERLQQIFDNLMQNALRYAPEGGWIKLLLKQEADEAVFSFHNNGPEIPDEALSHLFDRFYRGDKARDRTSGGTGLGLSIARKLAEAHGGTLTGGNHPTGGVDFKLTLPLAG